MPFGTIYYYQQLAVDIMNSYDQNANPIQFLIFLLDLKHRRKQYELGAAPSRGLYYEQLLFTTIFTAALPALYRYLMELELQGY